MRFTKGFGIGPVRRGPQVRRQASERPQDSTTAGRFSKGTATASASTDDPLVRSVEASRVEAALFSAEDPLSIRRLTQAAALKDATETRRVVTQLREQLKSSGAAFGIEEIAGGFQLLTCAAYWPWLARVRKPGHAARLTPALMETLTVLAYKQPLTRAELDGIRGVDCGELLKALAERGLVRTAGRQNSLGRPQLYGTSKLFLELFGFNALAELPPLDP